MTVEHIRIMQQSNILIARKVLDSPVTIQPGETYVFTYNFKIT